MGMIILINSCPGQCLERAQVLETVLFSTLPAFLWTPGPPVFQPCLFLPWIILRGWMSFLWESLGAKEAQADFSSDSLGCRPGPAMMRAQDYITPGGNPKVSREERRDQERMIDNVRPGKWPIVTYVMALPCPPTLSLFIHSFIHSSHSLVLYLKSGQAEEPLVCRQVVESLRPWPRN